MEAKDIASFQIDKSIVEGVVNKAIQTAVISQLTASQDILVAKIADWLVNSKCDEEGRVRTGYDSDKNKFTIVEVLFSQQLKEFSKAAIAEWIESNKMEIKKKFHEAMKKSNVADAFVGSMIANITDAYSTKVEVKFEKRQKSY